MHERFPILPFPRSIYLDRSMIQGSGSSQTIRLMEPTIIVRRERAGEPHIGMGNKWFEGEGKVGVHTRFLRSGVRIESNRALPRNRRNGESTSLSGTKLNLELNCGRSRPFVSPAIILRSVRFHIHPFTPLPLSLSLFPINPLSHP